jgi:hypothetical protein
MIEIDVTCPFCGDRAHAPGDAAGKDANCPNCGKTFPIPGPEPSPKTQARVNQRPPFTPRPFSPPEKKNEVVVTDVRIPFGSMVILMIKWAIAAIPAFIILALLGFLVSGLFMGGCAALLMGHK